MNITVSNIGRTHDISSLKPEKVITDVRNEKIRKIAVIGAYMGDAGKVKGAEDGARLIKSHCTYGPDIIDAGDIRPLEQPGVCHGLKNLKEVASVTKQIILKSSEAIHAGCVPFVIGGDHTCALGNIAAACDCYGSDGFGVLYLDAHGDINTPQTSDTGNLHGMPLACAMGMGDDELTSLVTTKVKPQNVMLLATRSLDNGEKRLIMDDSISVYSADEIRINGCYGALYKIRQFIRQRNIRHFHLSIDIDAMDPSLAPGTGVPEPKGISQYDFFNIVREVVTMSELVSIDLVEFNPSLDIDHRTENICLQLCNTISNALRFA